MDEKIKVLIEAVGDAPIMAEKFRKIDTRKSETFGSFSKKLKMLLLKTKSIDEKQSIFCYLSCSVAPPPSALLSDLVKNYGIDDKQIQVKYAKMEALDE